MLRACARELAIVAVLILLTLAAPAEAGAQSAAESGRDAEARVAFDAGVSALQGGRAHDALRYFREAHALSGRPEMLYNIALAADRAGELQDALGSYLAFLDAIPDTPLRAQIEARITGLRLEIERGGGRSDEPTPAPAAPRRTTRREGGWLFTWISLGASVSAGLVAGVSWHLATEAYGALERECAPACSPDRIAASAVELRLGVSQGFGVASAVLGAAAVVLFFVEMPHEVELEAEVAVVNARLSLGLGALAIEGTF